MAADVTLTIPNHLFNRAKQLTQRRRTQAVDELVDLLDQILASADQHEVGPEEEDEILVDPEVADEMQAYIAMHPRLKKTHLGKHVAIYGGKLVDTDEDYDALTRRIDAQYPDRFVWIATVEEEPIKTFVFRSPRLETVG
ncbi:MAG: hypothetical protein DYG89_19700 [Caldilinea sp. CFX5]|nr:hypothetical protein [Caldilinea sp. CFX5]